MVYATDAYAFFFADETDDGPTKGIKLVVEVDLDLLDRNLLYPDEDYVVKQMVANGEAASIDEVHSAVRDNLEAYRLTDGEPTWPASLDTLGTCAYQGVIPPNAITRYCVLNCWERPAVVAMVNDASPPMTSLHSQHRKLTSWLFGDEKKLPKMDFQRFFTKVVQNNPAIIEYIRTVNWRREQQWRGGIKVVPFGSP